MPDKDLWLRKIAAFLHDPPDKGYFFGTRDFDCLRYWVWISGSTQPPFYLNLSISVSDSSLQLVMQCLQHNWQDFVNYITQTNKYGRPTKSDLRNICQGIQISSKVLNRFQNMLMNLYNREFHRIASSNLRLNNFGLEYKQELTLTVIHPLDEKSRWDFESLTANKYKSNLDEQGKNLLRDEVLSYLKNLIRFGNSPQKIFLLLWRNPHLLSLLTPPEPIIPDNSLYDLEKMQSAISTTLDNKAILHPSFLILEFGPVQGFIENARKTRDLWFGSWLISYLSWQAMKPIAEKLGPDNIVYPDLYKQPLVDRWLRDKVGISDLRLEEDNLRLPTLPNTFLAIVKEGEEKTFARERVIKGLENAWKKLVEEVRKFLLQNKSIEQNSPLDEKFNEQTREFPFDIYWLGVKWGDDPEKAVKDYKSLFKPDTCWEFGRLWDKVKELKVKPNIGDTYSLLVEMTQTGLKSLKYRGRPQAVEEAWEKCTLCGERSALVDIDLEKLEREQSYVDKLIEKFKYDNLKGIGNFKKKRNKLYRRRLKKFWKDMSDAFPGHIKENEHLCAVCLVKRLAPKVMLDKYDLDYHFPSTGSITLAPFIKKLMYSGINLSPIEKAIEDLLKNKSAVEKRKIKNFLDAHFTEGRTVPGIKNRIISKDISGEKFEGDFEPEWFYDESFPRFYEELKSQGDDDKIDLAKGIEEAVTRIKKEAKDKLQDKYHLSKYYAAVYLDGDDLGKWLRGDKAPKIQDVFHPDFVKQVSNDPHFQSIKDLKRPVTPAIHRAISGALRDFALEVVPYVVEHNLGVVVYSGGDDTLFLIPLENLLKTLTALRKLYSGEQFVDEFGDRKFVSEKGFIKIYEKSGENWNLKEIIRAMGTKATLSAGIAIAHYLDPLDIILKNARGMLKEAKTYDGKDRAGFKVVMHSGSERKAIVPWKFVGVMERFKQKVSSGMSTRFLRTLYEKIDVYDEIPEAFDAEFIKFGLRGSGNASKDILCELKNARSEAKLTPSEFLNALLIGDFLAREEGAK